MLILAYDWREPLKNVICTPDCISILKNTFATYILMIQEDWGNPLIQDLIIMSVPLAEA